MEVRIVNLCNDRALPNKNLKTDWGNSFFIGIGETNVLFDTGYKGKKLMNNIKSLDISVDKLDKIVLSHGHRDHTGGVPAVLKARTSEAPISVIAHPNAMEAKYKKIFFFHWPIGFPKLNDKLAAKMKFEPVKEPFEVVPELSTIGEIPLAERPEKGGFGGDMLHKVNGKIEEDIVIDDLSLVLKSKNGLVLITGCCHSGLLNACMRVTRLFNERIEAIIGGTHMVMYSMDDADRVADILEKTYGTPKLYLNHCTGKGAIERLRAKLGPDLVKDFFVGSELTFTV